MNKERKKIQKEIFTQEFTKFCNKKFGEKMDSLDKQRIFYIIGIIIGILIATVGSILLFIFLSQIAQTEGNDDIVQGAIFPCIIGSSISGFLLKHYKAKAKKIILPQLLSFMGDFKQINLSIENQDEEIKNIKNLKLIKSFNRWKFDDCINGKYKDLDIKIRELDLKEVTGYGKSKRVKQIFKGILIKCPSFKNFDGFTLVTNEKFFFKPGEKISLEDVQFEKYFDVYGSNQIESRYLLTTAFIKRIVEIRNLPNLKNIKMSFENNSIYIAVPSTKDWFEIPIWKKANKISNYRAIVLELLSILSIIETLKLE